MSIVLVLAIIAFTLAIIYPFLISILTSAIIAYIFYPLYIKINNKFKRKNLSAFLTTLLVVILFILPLTAIINGLVSQSISAYSSIDEYLANNEDFMGSFKSLSEEKLGIAFNLGEIFSDFTKYIQSFTASFLTSLPSKIIQIFLFFFLLFYFLKEGHFVLKIIKELLPMSSVNKNKILKKLDDLIKAIIFGSLITATVQGILGGLGFFVLGINSPIFWGFLMAIFALIPFVGTGIIWFPAVLFLLVKGFTIQSPLIIGKGIGLMIYGIFIISGVDNFLKPYLIGDHSKLHPALILIGILGGLSLMGFIGIIFGPVIIALFLSLLEIYKSELKEEENQSR